VEQLNCMTFMMRQKPVCTHVHLIKLNLVGHQVRVGKTRLTLIEPTNLRFY
jgi:hypothetical protein